MSRDPNICVIGFFVGVEDEEFLRKKLEEEIPEALRGYWEVPLLPVIIHLRGAASPDSISALRGYTDDYASKEIREYVQSHFKEETTHHPQ